ncbi:MAG: hypothetical protein P4M09_30140 [Devosia sp.]|nr:hypothetical protein [Devosia sp.]
MVLSMARPWKHPKTGIYWLRRRVPDRLREVVGKLEIKKSLETKDPAEAKRLHAAALVELDETWAGLTLGVRSLSEREAWEVAQSVYSEMIAAFNDNPSEQDHWDARVAELHFRNGNIEKGGDPDVWQTVRSLPYLAMWQSVSHLKSSPLFAHLGAVTTFQAAAGPIDEVKQWALNLDFASPEIERITGARGIRASVLFEKFRDDTQSDLTLKAFSEKMAGLASEPEFPFEKSLRSSAGVIYPIRRKRG